MKGEIRSITLDNGNSFQIVWKKNPSVTGYELYRGTQKTGTYKKIAELQGENNVLYCDSDIKKGTIYYYKIRAYKNIDGSKIYGVMSSITQCAMK